MKHIVCYSGGHSSALVALHVAATHGTKDLILLNHDISEWVEHEDIKRFKREVAAHIGLPVTYANYKGAEVMTADQFDVCVAAQAFKVLNGQELCTNRLKTGPFMKYLNDHHPEKDVTIYYGFDANERKRVMRRSGILGELGFRTAFPLFSESPVITETEQIGIARPNTYSVWAHGNCVGCLKAGWQHWYVVYVTRRDVWEKAKWAEEEIGHAIHHDDNGPVYLDEMEPKFAEMVLAGVPATERIPQQTFWAQSKKWIAIQHRGDLFPCECVL